MVKRGDTVWYDHVEAKQTPKTRPAVVLRVLRVLGDTVLLVVGQGEPTPHSVLVQAKTHKRTRSAKLTKDTYFDCEDVIAAPLERVEGQLGRMPFAKFAEIERACQASLQQQVGLVMVAAEAQRRVFIACINQYADANRCEIEDIADQSGIARTHLRAVVSGDAWWTREQLIAIAGVLGVEPRQLVSQS